MSLFIIMLLMNLKLLHYQLKFLIIAFLTQEKVFKLNFHITFNELMELIKNVNNRNNISIYNL